MFKCKNKIWVENISELFCSTNIIPIEGESLESQMNSITRLVFIIYFALMLLEFKSSNLFLLLSLLFIIILYYIQRKQMENFKTEYYTPRETVKFIEKPVKREGRPVNTSNLILDNPTSCRFCNDDKTIEQTLYNLSGPPNPKTLINPVIAAPLADLDFWKANNLVVHSAINDATQHDSFQSGYQVSTCCGNVQNKSLVPQKKEQSKQAYQKQLSNPSKTKGKKELQENFSFPYEIREEEPGQMNTSCGYNPEQLVNSNLPSNFPSGNCQQQSQFSNYNKNLFTQTIQPGIYSRNQVIEPINSNIGISFQQQFEPLTCEVDSNGIMYTQNDPRIMDATPIGPNYNVINAINESNVYDPRHSGYGTSYRSYNDNQLGQTRFYYDDINAIRMPNYICRSNIDFEKYADSYGPIPEDGEYGNKYHSSIRALANDSFTRNSINQRTELMERLNRKQRANSWQQRIAPIQKNGSQLMLGGMGSCK